MQKKKIEKILNSICRLLDKNCMGTVIINFFFLVHEPTSGLGDLLENLVIHSWPFFFTCRNIPGWPHCWDYCSGRDTSRTCLDDLP